MTDNQTPLIQTNQLSKWYGPVIGLNSATLKISPGIIGLLGPNGAGKTTFIRLVTGLLKPSQGSVKVFGEPVWNNHRLFHRLGYCPEQDGLYDFMTGYRFLKSLAHLHGLTGESAGKQARQAIKLVKLDEVMDRPIGTYSKGMRQRIKLAQALLHNPDFLILDEPLAGTDPVVRRQLIDLLKDLGKQGKSILISSHLFHEIEALTDRIILINQGRILAEGTASQIRNLMNEYPHRVEIRANYPRTLAQRLVTQDWILSVRFSSKPDTVEVSTNNPVRFYQQLPEIVSESAGLEIYELYSDDDSIKAVFQYLVEGRRK